MNTRGQIGLSLASAEIDAEDLQALACDFCEAISRETDLHAELAHGAAAPGSRAGELVTVGNLVLTFISSGAAVALINVCKAFFERNSSIEMSFERGDGKKLTLKAQNVDSGHIAGTLETIRAFFGSAE